jgi:hypothetical protein
MQMYGRDSAKQILNEAFEIEFQKVMKLDQVLIGLGGDNHMGEAENLELALKNISSKSEQTDIAKKIQKMKVHISKLPEVQVET